MNKFIRVALAAIAFVATSIAQGQTLWTTAQYGITVEQVRAAFPKAVAASEPSKIHHGGLGLLTMPGIQLGSNNFRVTFYFRADHLEEVWLSLDETVSFDRAIVVFSSVEELLRAKYGTELQRKISHGSYNSADESWLAGPTDIHLYAGGVSGSSAVLNIVYSVNLSKQVEKL